MTSALGVAWRLFSPLGCGPKALAQSLHPLKIFTQDRASLKMEWPGGGCAPKSAGGQDLCRQKCGAELQIYFAEVTREPSRHNLKPQRTSLPFVFVFYSSLGYDILASLNHGRR